MIHYLVEILSDHMIVAHGPYDRIAQAETARAWIAKGRTVYWLDAEGPASVGRFGMNDGTLTALPFSGEAAR